MMLEAGATAPEVRLDSLNKNPFVLSEQLSQSAVVLAFFKISCPTCQFTLPFLDRLYSSEAANSPRLFGISQDKEQSTRGFAEHFGIHFPILLDPAVDDYPASNAYRITNVPSLFLIEPSGKVAWSLNGFHKVELEKLGQRFGRSPFETHEKVPALRPG